MALSSIHDVDSQHHHHHHHPAAGSNLMVAGIQHVAEHEKHFRPNPDAKPFIPNVPPFPTPSNWHFLQNDNQPKPPINGMIHQFWMGAPTVIDNENILANSSNTSKQHIAFHLVSNVLDDEIREESNNVSGNEIAYLSKRNPVHPLHPNILNTSNHVPNVPPPPPHTEPKIYGDANINELGHKWHQSAANFTLPVEVEKSVEKNSINNKTIHEIWSPDPSPNGLTNLSPNDEMVNSASYRENQLTESPSSNVESSDASFEQNNQNRVRNVKYENDVEPEENIHATPPYVSRHSNYYNAPHYEHPRHPVSHPGAGVFMHKNMYGMHNYRPVPFDSHYYGPPFSPHRYMGHYNQQFHPPRHKIRGNKYSENAGPFANHYYQYNGSLSFMEELGIGLDECRDQLRHLERDCKKADLNLLQNFRIRKPSVESYANKYPPNSTRVDKLIVDQEREHQKVESLIGRIERLGFTPMHPNVGVTLDSWLTAIKELRNTRKNELANIHDATGGIPTVGRSHTQEDVCNLIAAVKDLTRHTRSARTIVWCALQMLFSNNSSGASSGSGD